MSLTHEQIVQAIRHIAPAAEYVLDGDGYANLNWIGGGDKPTLESLEAAWDVIKDVEESPDSVSARQFKMQLAIAGLTETVEGWIGEQDSLVQIAYAYSSAFVKSEPMMQAGFAALGFTDEQIDAFFLAASKL